MRGPATRSPRTRAAAAAAASALLVALTACTAAPPGSAGLPAGVAVELRQLRSDVADRTAQVRVVNGTDAPIEVVRVEVADDRFDGVAERVRDSTIGPGRTVDLRIQLPPAACDADPAASASRVTLTLADGSRWQADLPDPLGFVPPLHARECLAQHVDETAALSWGAFEPGDGSAELMLAIDPAGGDRDLLLDEVRATNLLQFPGAAAAFPLDVAVDAAAAPSTVAVTIVPARCDPHAVMEDKRGTVFAVALHLDGVAGTIDLPAGEDLRGRILAWVADACGYATG